MTDHITEKTCPVGTRALFKNSRFHMESEAIVTEWSPSGKRVKFTYANGNTGWDVRENIYLVEKLKPLKKRRKSVGKR